MSHAPSQSLRLDKLQVKNFFRKIRVRVFAFGAVCILWIIDRTMSWRGIGRVNDAEMILSEKPAIFAFWHSRQLMMPWFYRRSLPNSCTRKLHMLISRHDDGRIIANAIRWIGIDSVAGSSSRGANRAALALVRQLEAGDHVAITPDGPKGPACKAKAGIIKIAQMTGAPIYPVAYSAERVWRFGSWDRMILPKPFSRAVWMVGKPITVPAEARDAELAGYLHVLEEGLQEVTKTVDSFEYV